MNDQSPSLWLKETVRAHDASCEPAKSHAEEWGSLLVLVPGQINPLCTSGVFTVTTADLAASPLVAKLYFL